MKVRYTRRALSDLVNIADYIGERNPSAAINVETAIRSSIGVLADFPMIGRNRPELNARALGIPRYSYTAYYRIKGEEISILHLRDDRRKPPARSDL